MKALPTYVDLMSQNLFILNKFLLSQRLKIKKVLKFAENFELNFLWIRLQFRFFGLTLKSLIQDTLE